MREIKFRARDKETEIKLSWKNNTIKVEVDIWKCPTWVINELESKGIRVIKMKYSNIEEKLIPID